MKNDTNITVVLLSAHKPEVLEKCLSSINLAARVSKIQVNLLLGVRSEESLQANLAKIGLDAVQAKILPVPLDLSIPEARNHLLTSDQLEGWIVFLDDDVILPEKYFSEFFLVRKRWPKGLIFGGPNLTPDFQTGVARESGRIFSSQMNLVCRNRYRKGTEGPRSNSRDFILCNLIVNASLEPRFSPNFPVGEELHYLRHELRSGKTCIYSPDLAVFHIRRETIDDLLVQMIKYGRGRGLVLRDEPLPERLFFTLICFIGLTASLPAFACRVLKIDESILFLSFAVPFAYARGVIAGIFEKHEPLR